MDFIKTFANIFCISSVFLNELGNVQIRISSTKPRTLYEVTNSTNYLFDISVNGLKCCLQSGKLCNIFL